MTPIEQNRANVAALTEGGRLPEAARFLVYGKADAIGRCMIAGRCVGGIVRPPLVIKLVTPEPRQVASETVQVVTALMGTSHLFQFQELAAGVEGGLELTGVEGMGWTLSRAAVARRPIQKDDLLIWA
jgi:hypothetical protein